MIGYYTSCEYVLLRAGTFSSPFINESIWDIVTFADTREDLEKYCKIMGYPLSENVTEFTGYCIIRTREYFRDRDNQVYREYLEKLTFENNIFPVALHDTSNKYIDTNTLNVGDEIIVPHKVYGNIPFIVIGKNHDAPDTVTILTKDILELLPFDAREGSSSNHDKQKYGNNRYLYSNLLQWMNSEADAGKWYTEKHPDDQAPINTWWFAWVVSYNPYADKAGFLHGFSSDFKRQLVTVNKITAKNTVTDGGGSEIVSGKAFLLSTTEVGLDNENNIAEGTIYEYFRNNNTDAQRVAYPSTYCLNNAGGYTNTNFAEGKGWHYWLRTPYSSYSCNERHVYTSGTLGNSHACYGYIGLRVGLVIRNYE